MGESTLCNLPSFPCTSMLALSIPTLDAFSNRCTSESHSADDESKWTAVRPASPLPMTAIRVLDLCVSIAWMGKYVFCYPCSRGAEREEALSPSLSPSPS